MEGVCLAQHKKTCSHLPLSNSSSSAKESTMSRCPIPPRRLKNFLMVLSFTGYVYLSGFDGSELIDPIIERKEQRFPEGVYKLSSLVQIWQPLWLVDQALLHVSLTTLDPVTLALPLLLYFLYFLLLKRSRE